MNARNHVFAFVLAFFLIAVVAIFLLLRDRMLPTWAINNLAMIEVASAYYPSSSNWESDFENDNHPWYSEPKNNLDRNPIESLQGTTRPDPVYRTLNWTLGRSLLMLDSADKAAEPLAQAATRDPGNPLLYHELTFALSESKQYDQVVSLSKQRLEMPQTAFTNDRIALAWLEQTGEKSYAEVLRLRPKDLYANYQLWREIEVSNPQSNLNAAYIDHLTHFDHTAVAPTDTRLLPFALQVIPALLEKGVWDLELATRAISFLVWRYPENLAVQELLNTLIVTYPAVPNWPYYLGELYQRGGDLDRAREQFERAFTLDETQRLENTTANETSLSVEQEIESLLTDTYGLPIGSVKLGPNLLSGGDFEPPAKNTLQSWQIVDSRLRGSDEALFLAGLDSLHPGDGKYAARIDGLWRKEASPHYYGLAAVHDEVEGAYWLPIEPQQIYLVSGEFRLSADTMRASVYLGSPQTNLVASSLPSSENQWQPFAFLGCHTQPEIENMQFIIEAQDPGTLWVDSLSIRTLDIENSTELCQSLTLS